PKGQCCHKQPPNLANSRCQKRCGEAKYPIGRAPTPPYWLKITMFVWLQRATDRLQNDDRRSKACLLATTACRLKVIICLDATGGRTVRCCSARRPAMIGC